MKIGPYEVLSELGRGGMGVVQRVRAPGGEELALKLLLQVDAETLGRFERERRLIGTFTAHDGFVPLVDAGTSPAGPYLVMPLLTGGTLRDRLRKGRLAIDEALALGRALAAALGRAHERGIVHRDLKPENILFDGDGRGSRTPRPLIADLGLAKHFDRSASGASVSLSRTGILAGTPGYLAPEQMDDSKHVGPQADVFALGAIVYECLAGEPPFQGAGPSAKLANTARGKVRPLREVRPEIPASIALVVHRALAARPEERFSSGLELLHALERPLPAAKGPLPLVLAAVVVSGGIVALLAVGARGAPVPPPVAEKPAPRSVKEDAPRGWFEEPLARGLRRGNKAPVYLFGLPAGGDMELVYVAPGDFIMGSDEMLRFNWTWISPLHTHPMPRGYWIGRGAVTWAQYRAFCHATGRSEPELPWWASLEEAPKVLDDHPVVMVSWHDADAYCKWAHLDLPTDAEWEKAARGDDGRRYPWGDDWDEVESPGERCNFFDAACPGDRIKPPGARYLMDEAGKYNGSGIERDKVHRDGFPFTSPVGSFSKGASPCGALDMAGNVSQWCADWYEENAYKRYANGDFTAPEDLGKGHLRRGGSWCVSHYQVAAYSRSNWGAEENPSDEIGFRVVLRTKG